MMGRRCQRCLGEDHTDMSNCMFACTPYRLSGSELMAVALQRHAAAVRILLNLRRGMLNDRGHGRPKIDKCRDD
eukprot:CAMPEP_0175859590 /NCGR_PEP_ID=MMETSP0107_2-20121207/30344_1 /TAXON_ID=195067 ORGANISM="Goniomonas pacifica, Strain CCMP1869" /NCGR_SAMPLE_ID=MMETSP0107_2 /ASSEMBLY_ACC=CAM_ASM_000203 /LENGTH=73 /DNA_ID=CAMNT_0017176235 /DNA_START=73 /DNA_END=291 /DNA_ORIENTATION=-